MIGLSGPHGTGKTTLAKAYAEKSGGTYFSSSATPTFERLGLNPSHRLSFDERLSVQMEVLNDLDRVWVERSTETNTITDRTPLDILMYLMASIDIGSVTGDEFGRFVARCFDLANRRFGLIVAVQPAFEIGAREGKGAADQAYIDHCNLLTLGLIRDDRLASGGYFMQRDVVSLESRIRTLEACVGRVVKSVVEEKSAAALH